MYTLEPLHLSAVQGDSEARNEPYKRYGEVSTATVNAAMRQKSPVRPAAPDGRVTAQGF